MAGWIATPIDRWLEQRHHVAGEWPSTLVVMDLRFWDDPIACGKRKRPSVRKLAETWGWNRGAATRLVKNRAEWADQRRASAVPASSHGHTTAEPLPSHCHTTAVPVDSGGTPAIESSHTSAVPTPYHERTTAVPLPSHEHTSAVPAPIETHAQSPTPSQAHPPHPTSTEAEVSAPPTASGQLFGSADKPAPAKPPKAAAKKAGPAAKVNKRAAAQRIYDAYRLHHPRNAEVPSRGDGKKLVDRLTDAARMLKGKRARYTAEDWTTAEQDLIDLSEWIHIAPDAKFWRGDNRDGSVHLGITSIYKEDKFGDRLQKMVAWRTGGRGTKPKRSGDRGDIDPAPEPVGPQTTGKQWKRLSELDDIAGDRASTAEQVAAALAEIDLIESNPGAPLP